MKYKYMGPITVHNFKIEPAEDEGKGEGEIKVPVDGRLVGQQKLDALKSLGLWGLLSKEQIKWLKADGRWANIIVKPTRRGLKIAFAFDNPRVREGLVRLLVDSCQKRGRTCKVQTGHCYVKMS